MEEITSQPIRPINSFLKFIFSVIKESTLWFFKGIASCASMVIGFFLVTTAILIALIALSGSGGSSSSTTSLKSQSDYRDYGGDAKIALIELSGIILEQSDVSNPISGGNDSITPDLVEESLNTVKDDKKIKAVILYISSPGGSPVASDRIYEIISDFKVSSNLPVIVMMGDVVASGGYYISSAADYIIANPSTITGSIGVILQTYNFSGLYEKVGIKKETFKSGKYKDILNDAREITPEEKVMINGLISDTYDTFIKRVADGRKMSESQVREVAEGKIYSGITAKEAGLIDQVGTVDDSIAYTANRVGVTKYKIVKIKTSGFLDELFSGIKFTLYNSGLNLSLIKADQPRYRVLLEMP